MKKKKANSIDYVIINGLIYLYLSLSLFHFKMSLPQSLPAFSQRLLLLSLLTPQKTFFSFTSIFVEDFSKLLLQMGKIRHGPDPKAALVSEICSLSRSPISCIHINRNSAPCFIDWYLILGVRSFFFLSLSILLPFLF